MKTAAAEKALIISLIQYSWEREIVDFKNSIADDPELYGLTMEQVEAAGDKDDAIIELAAVAKNHIFADLVKLQNMIAD